jgi:hypothetical protein
MYPFKGACCSSFRKLWKRGALHIRRCTDITGADAVTIEHETLNGALKPFNAYVAHQAVQKPGPSSDGLVRNFAAKVMLAVLLSPIVCGRTLSLYISFFSSPVM